MARDSTRLGRGREVRGANRRETTGRCRSRTRTARPQGGRRKPKGESTPAENGKSGGQIHVDELKKRGEEKYREPGRGHSAASRRDICLPIRLSCHRAGQASAGHGAGIQRHTPSTSVPGVGGPPGRRATARQKARSSTRHPACRGRNSRHGSGEPERGKSPSSNPSHRPPHGERDTEAERSAEAEETKHERRIHWRRPWKQPQVRGRNRMRAGTTQRRGTSREGHTANRRRGWIGKRRSTATQQAGCTARLITAIAMFVMIMGIAGPAAAQVLVSNIEQFSVGSGPTERLAGQSYAMPFTTGTNASGYILDSISIKFQNGSRPKGFPIGAPVGDPVYVYLQEDDGRGRPNHEQPSRRSDEGWKQLRDPYGRGQQVLDGKGEQSLLSEAPACSSELDAPSIGSTSGQGPRGLRQYWTIPGGRKTQAGRQGGRSETLASSTRTERRPAPTPQPEAQHRSRSRAPPTPRC